MSQAATDREPKRLGLRTWVHVLLLVALPELVYVNTLHNDYHLDSVFRVQLNAELEPLWPPWRFFTDRRTGTTMPRQAEYRPMMPFSHALDIAVSDTFGIDRLVGFHVGNIAVHIATGILLYLLFRELLTWRSGLTLPQGRLQDIAFAAALLFAVHPVSGVPVNYIVGRDLLLMMMFLTASLLVYANLRRRGDSVGRWCTVLGLLALSLLSKANAIMAFAIVFLFEYLLMRARLTDWRLWARVAAFGIATVGYFAVRWLSVVPSTGGLRKAGDLVYPLTMLKAHLFYYLRNVVWPFEMRPLPRIGMVESFADIEAQIGAAFILATLVLAWYLRKRSPLVAFSILTYWTLFALTSSIFRFRFAVTDYRQYPSLAFLSLAVVIGLFTLRRFRLEYLAVAALTLYFGLASVSMNTVWRTEESFWGQSVRYGGMALAHANYGLSVERKDPELAERHYRKALDLEPYHKWASLDLGLLYIGDGREAEGLALLQEIIARRPRWPLGYFVLAEGFRKLGRDGEAVAPQRRAADLDPRRLEFQYQAARALQRAGDAPASIPYLERVTAIKPDYRDTLFLLAVAHEKSARGDLAIDAYRGFLSGHPDHVEARLGLGSALENAGDCGAAVAHFERVLALQPRLAAAHRRLADCYRTLGDDVKAAEHATMYERLTP